MRSEGRHLSVLLVTDNTKGSVVYDSMYCGE